jgi:hypothetical protein
MQELMTSILGMGGKVFVIDVGRSFEKTVKLLNGTYLEFSTHSETEFALILFPLFRPNDPKQLLTL